MRTLKVAQDCIEFTPAYVADVRLFGVIFSTIFFIVAMLVYLEFGFVIGILIPIVVSCFALTLIRYQAIYCIKSGSVSLERNWINKTTNITIPLENFISIRIESNTSGSGVRRVKYYPVLWSKDDSLFSRLNYSFIGSISSHDFSDLDDFMRMLKVMSNLINLPVSFSKGCPNKILDRYAEV